MLAVGDVVLGAFLNNGHAAKGFTQLRAQLRRLALLNIHTLRLRQPSKLNHVGREDALLTPLHQLRAGLREEEAVGVQHEGDSLLARFRDDLRAGFLHQLVAPQPGADDDDVQPREHVDDLRGDGFGGFRGAYVL